MYLPVGNLEHTQRVPGIEVKSVPFLMPILDVCNNAVEVLRLEKYHFEEISVVPTVITNILKLTTSRQVMMCL
jgi:hypothetical protein